MVILSGYQTTPHHRQNRRRERPGSRTRRTITRKSNLQSDYSEGILDALDASVPLPSDKTRPSPLLRQNFDQSWQRWKAREAEEKALAEMEKVQLALEEQQRLFGGDVDDDELRRLGILYDGYNGEEIASDSNSVSCTIPSVVENSVPLFLVRQRKLQRSRRRPTWHSLPLYLSLSNLRDDTDIARLLSPSQTTHNIPTIQHRDHISISSSPVLAPIITDIPQSLPPLSPSALSNSVSDSQLPNDNIPPHSLDPSIGDWTFITNTTDTSHQASDAISPYSEPETWILLSDDS